MNRAGTVAMIIAVLGGVGVIAWSTAVRSGNDPGLDQPLHLAPADVPNPTERPETRLAEGAPEPRAQISSGETVPTASQPARNEQKNPTVSLECLYLRLQDFDSNRTWDTANMLLQFCIQVEWDANGRFEDVTNKWDEVDPADGHLLRKMPKYDPRKEGFISILDQRGSRWYRFTPEDFPEWWQLRYPEPKSETGQQEGIAMPKKVSADLAAAIRTRAAGLIEKYGDR